MYFSNTKKTKQGGNDDRILCNCCFIQQKIQESITISHLMQLKEEQLHIIVLDNSTDDYVVENKEYFPIDLLTYHSMGGNVGLSKAYNYALSILKDKSEDDIVIWFDDDTPVKQEYFDCLKNKVVDKTFDVFVPVIYGQNGVIYSPNESGWLKGKYIQSLEQQIPQNKFNAINSCLAVRLKAYKGYTYDEGLFMDCVDTKLFDDFRKKELKFCTLPVKIYQNFFQRSDSRNVQKYWNRFRIRIMIRYIIQVLMVLAVSFVDIFVFWVGAWFMA